MLNLLYLLFSMKNNFIIFILAAVLVYWFVHLSDDGTPEKNGTPTEHGSYYDEEDNYPDSEDLYADDEYEGEGYEDEEHENSDNYSDSDTDDYEDEIESVCALTNQLRKEKGLDPLSLDPVLCRAAAVRANELKVEFDHTRPSGRSCFSILDEMDISYQATAENIAQGQDSPSDVVRCWRNSSGHYKNMMNQDHKKIGIGYEPQSQSWVQLFTD